LCLRGGLGWWFGSLGINDFVNLEKISNPVNNEIVEHGNKENKLKTTMIATRLVLFLNLYSSCISENTLI
jgi:hypothetical protein